MFDNLQSFNMINIFETSSKIHKIVSKCMQKSSTKYFGDELDSALGAGLCVSTVSTDVGGKLIASPNLKTVLVRR